MMGLRRWGLGRRGYGIEEPGVGRVMEDVAGVESAACSCIAATNAIKDRERER